MVLTSARKKLRNLEQRSRLSVVGRAVGEGGAGSLWWCSGVVLLRVDEGGVVFFLGLGEFIFVGCHMIFVGQTVDSEGCFFGEPLQPATSCGW